MSPAAAALAAALVAAPQLRLQALDGRAAPAPLRSAVVMFWRADCGPCRLELGDLAALRAAAAPLRLELVGLQDAGALRAGLRKAGLRPQDSLRAGGDPAAVLTAWGGAPPRLPLAAAVDAQGRLCDRHTGLLGRDRARAWGRTCGARHAGG